MGSKIGPVVAILLPIGSGGHALATVLSPAIEPGNHLQTTEALLKAK